MDAQAIGTVQDGTLTLDRTALLKELGLAPVAPVGGAAADDVELEKLGLPSLGKLTSSKLGPFPVGEAVVGGLGAIVTAKAVAKLFPALSHPVVADAVAFLLLWRFGRRVLGESGAQAAKLLLTVDILRGLFPVVDNGIQNVVNKLPSVGPSQPFVPPTFGALGDVAAMRQGKGSGPYIYPGRGGLRPQTWGYGAVIDRRSVTNI